MDKNLVATAAAARKALGNVGAVIGGSESITPRYELFHAAASICSQKVRAVLAHHTLPYVSQSLSIFDGQTYLPGYVRLRMLGCERYGGALVSHHSGSTSAASGGCDGAVVPTLIDWHAEEVIVDSHRICQYLDGQMPERQRLRPDHLAASIDEDLDIVDNLPNYQMLMGRAVSGTETAATRDGVGAALSRKKVAWCDHYLAEFPSDVTLVAAYTAKRAKELSAAQGLFALEAMQAAYARAEDALVDLERKLEQRRATSLYGDSPTMADLFWGIALLRMKNTGAEHFWANGRLPHVENFCTIAEQMPAIKLAIIDWPDALY